MMFLAPGYSPPPAPSGVELSDDFNLAAHNTLALPSRARYGAVVTNLAQLERVIDHASNLGITFSVIGGGSNLVLRPEIAGAVFVMATKGRVVIGQDRDRVFATAQAGEDWSDFVDWTVAQGLSGLENLAGIPGTVGAAPVQNIGAYGLELKDRFHSLTAYDRIDRRLRVFSLQECRFGYRQSVFKESPGRYIVTDVTFALPLVWRPVLHYPGLDVLPVNVCARDVMERVLQLRRSKLPDWRTIPNAGSFFHNPLVTADVADEINGAPRYEQSDGRVKLSAAWLIEQCGLKGAVQGGASICERHALILVNRGGATYDDIADLASRVRAAVRKRYGIDLVQEPTTL